VRHIPTDGRADVIAYENRTITADDNSVEMYDNEGTLLLNIPTDGRSQITIFAEELLVTLLDGTTTTYTLFPPTPPSDPPQIFLPMILR
jgi:hypothetical protein